MEEIKQLSDDVFEQLKDFIPWVLTQEQESFVDKLISDEELKIFYTKFGLCHECKQPKNNDFWCRICVFQRNFKNWASGNDDVDRFIQQVQLKARNKDKVLEWIEYDKFENIEYLAKGGFGTVSKAIWKDGPIDNWDSENNQWKRQEKTDVALKCLHNSQGITAEFLREIETHLVVNSNNIVKCYGITKEPETNNFIMVMAYAQDGSLRQHLNKNFNSLSWNDKLNDLWGIASGLKKIHEVGLIHHDFHCGNILFNKKIFEGNFQTLITGLGLSKPASATHQDGDKEIYGVLPYVAPEVLRGEEYTQASDIYGFGIIAYELCTGLPPYHDIVHDEFLAIEICQGLRPKSNYKIPQLILNLIEQCWDADPLKRPRVRESLKVLKDLHNKSDEDSTINEQIKEADEINENLSSPTATSGYTTRSQAGSNSGILSYTIHPKAVYISRLLDFKNLPKPKNADISSNTESDLESTRI